MKRATRKKNGNNSANEEDKTIDSVKEDIERLGKWLAKVDHQLEFLDTKIDFVKGLYYGLFYGIFGNVLVQFLYGIIEHLVLGNYDLLFLIDVCATSFSFVVLICITISFAKRLKTAKQIQEELDKEREDLRRNLDDLTYK